MIIRGASLTKSLWKNGGGTTTEIVRVGGVGDAYDWRASFADVQADGPFSEFAGYDRALVLLGGGGLRLNGRELQTLEPFYFRGEEKISAELIDGDVRDFGVIYRRDLYACRIDLVRSKAHVETLLFVIRGDFQVGSERLTVHDSWLGASTVEPSTPDALAVGVTLTRR